MNARKEINDSRIIKGFCLFLENVIRVTSIIKSTKGILLPEKIIPNKNYE